ncbi:tetratricopeptide repeat protein [Micromonospora sp. HNM0581]|uniref:tetratricopeptide repeat protein n=1 Tax=Micromonospora sp. HNM0581 TaxID=2716341 RepID=UPI00146D5050|nr:tetratricopeptide repeat protein [Micromonospora sp. HNM0581]NLU77825.1 tetratricopeptide repeat protein [Micromonospora sp. HNM0581]
MQQIFGSLACGAVLLVGVSACSSDNNGDDREPPSSVGAASNGSTSDPAALIKQGVEEGKAGKLDQARTTFEQIVAVDENNKLAWFNLGYIAQSRGQTEEAIRSYDRALRSDPEYKPALFNKAIALESTDRQAAIELYRKVVGIDDEASTAYLRLGLLLAAGDDNNREAQQAFDRALEIDEALAKEVPNAYRSTGNR